MNDPPNRSPAPPPPVAPGAADTVIPGPEATGGAHTLPAPPGMSQSIGEFAVLQKLGEGGMGAVYLAEDTKLRRKVAIKTMRSELAGDRANRERFEREARAAAAVGHDNIVPILHFGEAADGTPFIVMPFLKGEMLDARLKREVVADLDTILKVARDVADGLAAAHAAGLVHRDIKPGNIWLEGDPSAQDPAAQVWRCKILDFGLVRSVVSGDVQITGTGAVLGTPAYMAPEQARGKAVDHRADLFSLGVTLYRAAVGKLPFEGPDAMAVLIALTTEDPSPVRELAPNLPPALAALIERLMHKDPARRPQSAAEVSAAVRQIERDCQGQQKPTPTAPVRIVPHAPGGELTPSDPELLSAVESPTAFDLSDPPAPRPAASAKPPRRLPWLLAGLVVLALAVPLSLLLAGVFSGKKSDSDVAQKNDPLKNPQTQNKGNTPVVTDPDRTAAEYILSRDGGVALDGAEEGFKGLAKLPPEPAKFKLTGVRINDRPLTDDGLAVFENCTNVEHLDIGSTAIGNAGLKHFSGCKNLKHLDLGNTRVTDASVATIKGFAKLKYLQLEGTDVTAQAIAELKRALPAGCDIRGKGTAAPADPERRAAEFVLSLKGSSIGISTDDYYRDVEAVGELPKEPFWLSRVRFAENSPVTDEGLAVFKPCRSVLALNLKDTPVSDAGLAHFAGCKHLKYLYLHNTKVGGKGLAALKDFTDLKHLVLSHTQVTDADLVHIKRFTALEDLHVGELPLSKDRVDDLARALPGCRITWDGGVIEPKIDFDAERRAALWVLSTPNAEGSVSVRVSDEKKDVKATNDLPKEAFALTEVTLIPRLSADMKLLVPKDADLAVFKDCKHVTSLFLVGTGITNEGLAHFGNCKDLKILHLSGTKIDDGAATTIKRFKSLETLTLGATDIQEKGVREIASAVPGCRIEYGYTIEPATGADRTAAEWVLSIGGAVRVNGQEKDIKATEELPKELFRLTTVNLASNPKVTDTGLAPFGECKNVTHLALFSTQVGDKGLAHFKDCKNLAILALSDTKVTDAGLAHFRGFRYLTELSLTRTQVGDVGLANFGECTNLMSLTLDETQVSDAGLKTIRQFTNLASLYLKKTKVSEKGAKELGEALPNCKIEWNGGTIGPKKK